MNRYVDIHAHVLYGIDDGPVDRADAEAMLRTASRSGTAAIVATPHLRSDFPDVHVEKSWRRAPTSCAFGSPSRASRSS